MTTRQEIEAKVAARLGTVKPTRAEIEARVAARIGASKPKFSTSEYLNSNAAQLERQRMQDEDSANRSFGENMAIKSADVIGGIGSGISQLYSRGVGDQAGLAEKQAAEEENRRIMEPVSNSAGGVTGNVLTNAALFALPAAKVAQGAKWAGQAATLAPKTAALITALAGEGLIGGASGAMTPTVEGESLGKNIGTSAAINAAFPLAGSFLRTAPVQKAADTILDYTPFLSGSRRRARNNALREIHDLEVAGVNAANKATKADFRALSDADKLAQREADNVVTESRKAAVDEAKQRTQYVKALTEATAENETRGLQKEAQQHLADSAGWNKFPLNKVEAEKEVSAIGKAYGDMIEPIRMPALNLDGIDPTIGSDVASQLKSIAGAVKRDGSITGTTYKTVRADTVEALKTAKGDERKALQDIVARLDAGFESAIPKEIYEDVMKKRAQYSLGSTMLDADWIPGKGATAESLRKRIDKKWISQDVREALYPSIEKLAKVKDVPRVEASVPRDIPDAALIPSRDIPDLLPTPNTPNYENQDILKINAIRAGAMGLTGGLAGTFPVIAGGVKAANNDKIAKMVAALNRGAATGYGTVLAPKED